jgi:hypothetical protein
MGSVIFATDYFMMKKYVNNLFGGALRLCLVTVCMANFIASSLGGVAVIATMQGNQDMIWYEKLFFWCIYVLWTGLSIPLLLYTINRFNKINFVRLVIFPVALAFSIVTATGPAFGLLYMITVFPLIVVTWNFLLSCLLHLFRKNGS